MFWPNRRIISYAKWCNTGTTHEVISKKYIISTWVLIYATTECQTSKSGFHILFGKCKYFERRSLRDCKQPTSYPVYSAEVCKILADKVTKFIKSNDANVPWHRAVETTLSETVGRNSRPVTDSSDSEKCKLLKSKVTQIIPVPVQRDILIYLHNTTFSINLCILIRVLKANVSLILKSIVFIR